jgi:hypothetical protein
VHDEGLSDGCARCSYAQSDDRQSSFESGPHLGGVDAADDQASVEEELNFREAGEDFAANERVIESSSSCRHPTTDKKPRCRH